MNSAASSFHASLITFRMFVHYFFPKNSYSRFACKYFHSAPSSAVWLSTPDPSACTYVFYSTSEQLLPCGSISFATSSAVICGKIPGS